MKEAAADEELLQRLKKIEPVPLEDNENMAAALLSKEVDAVVTNITLEYWRESRKAALRWFFPSVRIGRNWSPSSTKDCRP